ncbi:hypothetical protein EDB84DRAFT_1603616 [Lactarius hengduanensis]|nr:hypothetical protein EDB84DRAFT_1603616 [Lactarius hengduanensis]
MQQSRAKNFLKKMAGVDGSGGWDKKLDKLTNEEVAMASAQILKATHTIDNKVTAVGDGVKGVDEKVQVVNDNVKSDATEVKIIVQQTTDRVDDVKQSQLRESLRKWQSPPDPSTNHNIAGDRQHEGTAEWFFESSQFENWKLTGSLLWIHGKRTFLYPWPRLFGDLMDPTFRSGFREERPMLRNHQRYHNHVRGRFRFDGVFYFDFRDLDKQPAATFFRHSSSNSLHIPMPFVTYSSRLYETHDKGARQPSDKASTQCLKEMLTLPNQGPVYLILDALDECPDTSGVPSARKQVLDLLKELDERGQKKDIASYVRSVVCSESSICMRKWREEDKEHVIETLSERADGMFRWVFCQVEVLQKCLPQNVQRVLSELPNSLDETYERMLREIGKVNPDQAYRLLQCLTVAIRPLRVDELAEVLALDFDRTEEGIPVLNSAWRWDDEQQGVLSTCSSLIVVVGDKSSKTRVVQFAHFSVKEFLTSDRLARLAADISQFHIRPEPAHTVIAQACLAILLRSNCDMAESGSPLSHYATQHWVDHAQFESVSLHVEDGMRSLFDPTKPYFPAWVKSFDIDRLWYSFVVDDLNLDDGSDDDPNDDSDNSDVSLQPDPSNEGYTPLCLYYAALCGFHDLTKHLIVEYPQHVNARVGLNRSPLAAALSNKHIQVAELASATRQSLKISLI